MESIEIERGDRVKLAHHVAKQIMDAYRRPHKTNWYTRRGTVTSISKVTDNLTVQWDDRTTVDHWPIRALERIPINEPA
jgi:hypothetical protein